MNYTAELYKFRTCDSHFRIAYRFSSCPFVSFLLELTELQKKARKGMSKKRYDDVYGGWQCQSPEKDSN